jgi:DNA-binding winged helix-turn-helix (wHTH) protein
MEVRLGCRNNRSKYLSACSNTRGRLLTREELRQRLWSANTFVDFERSLNAAVKRLREALGDSAENARFIETLPRHGYRLIVPVEKSEPETCAAPTSPFLRPNVRHIKWALAMTLAFVLGIASSGRWRERLLDWFHPVQIESLAVLPLSNLSNNPEEDYFTDGMTEALITELGKVPTLRIISRQSVMQYKGTKKTLPQIAQELHVDAVVEGFRCGLVTRCVSRCNSSRPARNVISGQTATSAQLAMSSHFSGVSRKPL